jgi:site-specific recombinase XerD
VIDDRTLPDVLRHEEPSLRFIVNGFLARYPERTRYLYTIHLKQWFEFCRAANTPVLAVHRAHIETWARHLEEHRHLRPQSVRAKLNAVCGLYRFAAADGFIQSNPGAYVRRPKIEFASSSNGFTRVEAAALVNAAEQHSPMAYAWTCLLMFNGLRVGELLASNVEHLGYERGYRTLLLPNRKGGKVGLMSLPVRSTWAVEQILHGRTTGPLLLGATGDRLSYGALTRTFKKLTAEVGVTKRVTPHSCRHTLVSLALDAGVAERDIMDTTGHSTPSMLRFYDRHKGSVERNASHAVSAFIGLAG